MKNKILQIAALIFFVIVNTSYYWEGIVGHMSMPITLFLFLLFILLGVTLIYHIVKSIFEKFKSKNRNILLVILTLVIGLTIYKPFGIIDFKKLEGEDLLFAHRIGVANCMITLKLKEKGKFIERSVCFGVEKTNGNYVLKNDTIWFSNIKKGSEFYQFGTIINVHNSRDEIALFKHKNDTIPLRLFVNKNHLQSGI